MRRPIVNHTKRGELVYDPFLGSGTILVAAEMTGRACCGLELDPKYVDVIIGRWQELAGKQAVLDGLGATFQQVQAQRPPRSRGGGRGKWPAMKSLARRIQRLEATLLPAAETDFDRMLRERLEAERPVLLTRSAKVRPLPSDQGKKSTHAWSRMLGAAPTLCCIS